MDFEYGPEAEAFRARLRDWIEAELDPALREGGRGIDLDAERIEPLRAWNHKLADAGYAAPAWPREYGGLEAGIVEQLVHAEEMARADAPGPLNPIGLSNIAPAIMEYGTPEQRERFLRPMLRGDEIWSQGFSEPQAGSDLASLRTSAVADGDSWIVNGQKIWNTFGHHAQWCELLVRTDPDAGKHGGISCFLVDLSLPGIEARPLRTIAGTHEFAELFFTDVRVPGSALLGPLHQGWRVALTTLSHERAGVASLHLRVRRKIARLIADARSTPRGGGSAFDAPLARHQIMRAYVMAENMKALADRAISQAANGRPPGPEGSLVKLVWSDVENRVAEAAGEALGMEANGGRWGHDRVYVRSVSIAGGTSQVNKNIIAGRVLGLPRSS